MNAFLCSRCFPHYGAYGTFVAWQEGGILHAQHLLPTGDIDPVWPAALLSGPYFVRVVAGDAEAHARVGVIR